MAVTLVGRAAMIARDVHAQLLSDLEKLLSESKS